MTNLYIVTDDQEHKAIVAADDTNQALALVRREYGDDSDKFNHRAADFAHIGHSTTMGEQVILAVSLDSEHQSKDADGNDQKNTTVGRAPTGASKSK